MTTKVGTGVSSEVNEASFAEVVVAGSAARPVVVDFWAPWCGPCRVLGPVLEAEVAALADRVAMVKVNTDQNPALAAEYNIQGIPAVKAFRDGKVVSEFVGARPATFVRAWLAALAPSGAAQEMARALQASREGRPAESETTLRGLIDDPEVRDQARLLLARQLLLAGRGDEVAPLIAAIDPRSTAADAIPAIERVLALGNDANARAAGGEEAARAALARDPQDLAARYALAGALTAKGDLAGALEELLAVVTRSRKFKEDGARLAMLALFDQLGNDHPLSQDFRRRLQIVL
jgi:putative thioredoxin